MSAHSKAEVFIIESLRLNDEKHDRLEGERIARMLKLSRKECKYFYIRSATELRHIMQLFTDSKYRYLHLSCHGSETGLTTTFDPLGFKELREIVNPHLDHRRVFLSACRAASMPLISTLMTTTGCYSVMGPYNDIQFGDAALFWATFYHLMFQVDGQAMSRDVIEKNGRAAARLFKLRMKLFTRQRGKITPHILR